MHTRLLGAAGPALSAIGLGCMGMSDFYGPADRRESLATIDAAITQGVTWLDTGDFYGMGDNELLLAEALAGRKREDLFIALKFGAQRAPDGSFIGMDNRPNSIRNFLCYSLRRLGTDYVDMYLPTRIDPDVPIEDTVGAIKDLIGAGYVRHIGLSEASASTLRRAHAVHPIAALQFEYSLVSRDVEPSALAAARELGVALVAYAVLCRGLLSGRWTAARANNNADFRAHLPRFTGSNLAHNLTCYAALESLAAEAKTTVTRLAIAWVLSRGDDVLTLIGARTRAQLNAALGAADLQLPAALLRRIEELDLPRRIAGARYLPEHMAMLDSESAGETSA